MSLSWRQRRTLRALERKLAKQDPQLAGRLERPPEARSATVADWVGWAMFVLALILLGVGLVLIDRSLLKEGLLILGLAPPLVVLVAAASRVSR
jgi:Protein of unknown function (DUF3040)